MQDIFNVDEHAVTYPEFILRVTTQLRYLVRQLAAVVHSEEAMALNTQQITQITSKEASKLQTPCHLQCLNVLTHLHHCVWTPA